MTTQTELHHILSQYPKPLLIEILESNQFTVPKDASAESTAKTIAEEVWKQSHTPLSEWVKPKSLEQILQIYSQKLDIDIDDTASVAQQLEELRVAIMSQNPDVQLSDIPNELKDRLEQSIIPNILGFSAAGGAVGTRWAAFKFLDWTNSKWLDLIKFIPKIGPTIIVVRGIAGTVARFSGPIGIAIALWSVNQSLGPKWDRCLGLLLGISLCLQTPVANAITPST